MPLNKHIPNYVKTIHTEGHCIYFNMGLCNMYFFVSLRANCLNYIQGGTCKSNGVVTDKISTRAQ